MENATRTQSLDYSSERLSKGPKSHWKLLKHTLRASTLFKTSDATVVQDIDEFCDNLNRSPSKLGVFNADSMTTSAIENHKILDRLFFFIKRSQGGDLLEIKELIESHPLKYVRSCTDPEYFLNKCDTYGIRPIYEASRCGYVDTVKLLLDYGANPKLNCNGENCLQVACRWNHYVVVKCLLNEIKWAQSEIKLSIKAAKNSKILELLKKYSEFKQKKCRCLP